MATDIVQKAISAILQDEDFDLNCPRMKEARESAHAMLDAISGDNHYARDTFARFAKRLYEKLEALATPTSGKTLSTQKQHLWSGFHLARLGELRSLWTDLYASLGLESRFSQDPLLGEYVNEKVFGEHIKVKFRVDAKDPEPAELTDDDLNALRYAAGYVPWKLRQKFKKAPCKHPNWKAFLVCLEKMSIGSQDENDDSYLEYTKKWICAIDRGGLFHISEEVYALFIEIERMVRIFVVKLVSQNSQENKEDLIEEIVSDDDIQFYWSMISVDLDSHDGEQLLQEIVKLWVTIRGFSTAGAFVEQYKQVTEKSTKKSTGLRKGLKRKKSDTLSED